MRSLARIVLLLLVASAASVAAPASAQDSGADAVNTKDGKSVFKLAFSVKKATGDVDASNTAVAYASCTDCRTVAAAIQIVLVSDPGDLIAQNQAVAINYQCTECETLSRAFQFVFGDGEEMVFTKDGKDRLHELRKRFYDLKQRDDLTLQQLAAEIGAIAAEVVKVVDRELVAKDERNAEPTTTTVGTAAPTTTSPLPPTSLAPTTTSPPTTVATTSTTAGVTTTTTSG